MVKSAHCVGKCALRFRVERLGLRVGGWGAVGAAVSVVVRPATHGLRRKG
jgi:hypothetical protein